MLLTNFALLVSIVVLGSACATTRSLSYGARLDFEDARTMIFIEDIADVKFSDAESVTFIDPFWRIFAVHGKGQVSQNGSVLNYTKEGIWVVEQKRWLRNGGSYVWTKDGDIQPGSKELNYK